MMMPSLIGIINPKALVLIESGEKCQNSLSFETDEIGVTLLQSVPSNLHKSDGCHISFENLSL